MTPTQWITVSVTPINGGPRQLVIKKLAPETIAALGQAYNATSRQQGRDA